MHPPVIKKRSGRELHVHSKGFWRWCIILRISGFLDFVHRLVFQKLESTTFRKLDLFPSWSGEGDMLGPLEYRTMDKVRKPNNSERTTCLHTRCESQLKTNRRLASERQYGVISTLYMLPQVTFHNYNLHNCISINASRKVNRQNGELWYVR
jgi:hypothetical protein